MKLRELFGFNLKITRKQRRKIYLAAIVAVKKQRRQKGTTDSEQRIMNKDEKKEGDR